MIKRLKRIGPLQLGKMLGLLYALLSLIFVPFFLLFTFIASFAPAAVHSPVAGFPALLGVGMGISIMVFVPVMYGFMGFVTGVIGAFVYNLVAKWVGGIEVEVE